MEKDANEHFVTYKVVINHEGYYSIWPVEQENAPGWNYAGKSGTKEACLAYIQHIWIDMRPLSLQKQTEPTMDSPAETGGRKNSA